MVTAEDLVQLPPNFVLAPELRSQLSSRAGHQRCLQGAGELFLVLHEVPEAGVPERQGLYFWKNSGGWWQQNGKGLSGVSALLDRFEGAIDIHEAVIDEADTAIEIFTILRHAGPLMRCSRNLAHALEQVLSYAPEDREIRTLRDRAKEIERAADLLNQDARITLEFWQAERSEQQANLAKRLGKIAYRLNLLAGFFLPLVALGGLFGMNVKLPDFTQNMFWGIVSGGLGIGLLILWAVAWQTGLHAKRTENE